MAFAVPDHPPPAGASDLPPVTGLEAFWSQIVHRGAPIPSMQGKLLLDALGIGTEQTYRHLGGRPDFADFRAWIGATAGPLDAMRLARYEAVVAGVSPPEPVAAWLAAIDAADDVLGADDLAAWDERGVVVLRGAVTLGEAAAVARLLWDEIGADPADPNSWYGGNRPNFWIGRFQHPALERARRSPRIHKAFAQLWGTADLWMTTDQLSFNPPERGGHRFQGSPLHWDVSLARPIPFATQAILYLTDTAADQGALRVVPGFHRRIDAWLDGLGAAHPREADLGEEAVTIPAGAGDLVIWRNDLPHGASPNTADRPRLAQYLNMYPAWLRHHETWI